ncbi:MAG: hypothetical protein N2035_00760 [Chthoniobacterales bacterium]|nr:hypothetical protein [Chthoniobacterales bacterium]
MNQNKELLPGGEILFAYDSKEYLQKENLLEKPPLAFFLSFIIEKFSLFDIQSGVTLTSTFACALLISATYLLGFFAKNTKTGLLSSMISFCFAGLIPLARDEPAIALSAGFTTWSLIFAILAQEIKNWIFGFWSCVILCFLSSGIIPIFLLILGTILSLWLCCGNQSIKKLLFTPAFFFFLIFIFFSLFFIDNLSFEKIVKIQIPVSKSNPWLFTGIYTKINYLFLFFLILFSLWPWLLMPNIILHGLTAKKSHPATGVLWILPGISLILLLLQGFQTASALLFMIPAISVGIAICFSGLLEDIELDFSAPNRALTITGIILSFLLWMFPWWGGQLAVEWNILKRQMEGFWLDCSSFGAREFELLSQQILPGCLFSTFCGFWALFFSRYKWNHALISCWLVCGAIGVWTSHKFVDQITDLTSLRNFASWLQSKNSSAIILVDQPKLVAAQLAFVSKNRIFWLEHDQQNSPNIDINKQKIQNLLRSSQILLLTHPENYHLWKQIIPDLEILRRRRHYLVLQKHE